MGFPYCAVQPAILAQLASTKLLLNSDRPRSPSSLLCRLLLLLQSTPGAYHTSSIFLLELQGLLYYVPFFFCPTTVVLLLDLTNNLSDIFNLLTFLFCSHTSSPFGSILCKTTVNCFGIYPLVFLDSRAVSIGIPVPQPAYILLPAEHEPVTSSQLLLLNQNRNQSKIDFASLGSSYPGNSTPQVYLLSAALLAFPLLPGRFNALNPARCSSSFQVFSPYHRPGK